MVMKTLAVAGLAGLLAIVALAAYGGMDTTASRDLSKRKAVADDAGNLHVPDTYRTTYELLGSWGNLKCVGGSQSDHWNYVLANQTFQTLWIKHSDEETRDQQFSATAQGLVGIGPRDELEGMIAAQLLAAHNAA